MPVPSLDDQLFQRKSSSSSSSAYSSSSSSSSSSGRNGSSNRLFDKTHIVRIPSDVEICSDYGSDTFDMHQKTQGVVLPRPKSADRRNERNFYQELLRASWNEYRMEQVGSDNGNDGPYDSLEHYESSGSTTGGKRLMKRTRLKGQCQGRSNQEMRARFAPFCMG